MEIQQPVHDPDCRDIKSGEAGSGPGDTLQRNAYEYPVIKLAECTGDWHEQGRHTGWRHSYRPRARGYAARETDARRCSDRRAAFSLQLPSPTVRMHVLGSQQEKDGWPTSRRHMSPKTGY